MSAKYIQLASQLKSLIQKIYMKIILTLSTSFQQKPYFAKFTMSAVKQLEKRSLS